MRDEEEVTAELLRLAGARPEAPLARASRVRLAVYREWRSTYRRRAVRRRAAMAAALLATAAAVVLVVRSNTPRPVAESPPAAILATTERIEGEPRARRQTADRRSIELGLTVQTPLRANDVIETDQASRASWRAADGSSVRLDRGSRVQLSAAGRIELVAGGVYIATSGGSKGFEVRTPLGTVHDIGTRFEVRLNEAWLRIRVRSGGVEIRRSDQIVPAPAGTEATLTSSHVVTRSIATHGSDWDWTAALASSYAIEGRSLAAYIEYLATEEGWTVHYADPKLATAAATITLHGSVDGLRPEEALGVALATSGLDYRLRDEELFVFRPPAR